MLDYFSTSRFRVLARLPACLPVCLPLCGCTQNLDHAHASPHRMSYLRFGDYDYCRTRFYSLFEFAPPSSSTVYDSKSNQSEHSIGHTHTHTNRVRQQISSRLYIFLSKPSLRNNQNGSLHASQVCSHDHHDRRVSFPIDTDYMLESTSNLSIGLTNMHFILLVDNQARPVHQRTSARHTKPSDQQQWVLDASRHLDHTGRRFHGCLPRPQTNAARLRDSPCSRVYHWRHSEADYRHNSWHSIGYCSSRSGRLPIRNDPYRWHAMSSMNDSKSVSDYHHYQFYLRPTTESIHLCLQYSDGSVQTILSNISDNSYQYFLMEIFY